jgi:hypothetical protein
MCQVRDSRTVRRFADMLDAMQDPLALSLKAAVDMLEGCGRCWRLSILYHIGVLKQIR